MLTLLQGLALASLSLRQRGGGEGPPEIPTCWQRGAGHRGRREAVACGMRPPQAWLALEATVRFPHCPQGLVVGCWGAQQGSRTPDA